MSFCLDRIDAHPLGRVPWRIILGRASASRPRCESKAWSKAKAARCILGFMMLVPLSVACAAAELTFAVARTPMSLPIYVAQSEGYFADESVSVRITDCAFGRLCLSQLLDGKAALCTVADLPIAFASFTSNRFAILATLATNRSDAKIITRKSNKVRAPADLRGKKVGVAVGTSAHYFLDSVALLSGLDPANIRLVDLRADEMAAQLAANQVDALSAFEPYAFEAAKALGGDALVLSISRTYTLTWNLVAATDDLATSDRDMEGVLRALDRAIRLIHGDPARAKAVLKLRLGLDDEAVAWVWPDLVFELGLTQSLIKTMEGEARWALRSGYARGREPNYLRYIHEGPLNRVKPGSVAIVR